MRKIIVLWMVLMIVSLRAFADSKVSFTASAPDVDLYFGPFYPPAGPVAAVYSGPGFADSAAGLSASFATKPNYNVFHHLSGYYVMTAYMLLPLCHNMGVI